MRTTFEDARRIADLICAEKKTGLVSLTWYEALDRWVANFSYIDGKNSRTVDRVSSFVELDRDTPMSQLFDDYEENKFFYEEEYDTDEDKL